MDSIVHRKFWMIFDSIECSDVRWLACSRFFLFCVSLIHIARVIHFFCVYFSSPSDQAIQKTISRLTFFSRTEKRIDMNFLEYTQIIADISRYLSARLFILHFFSIDWLNSWSLQCGTSCEKHNVLWILVKFRSWQSVWRNLLTRMYLVSAQFSEKVMKKKEQRKTDILIYIKAAILCNCKKSNFLLSIAFSYHSSSVEDAVYVFSLDMLIQREFFFPKK